VDSDLRAAIYQTAARSSDEPRTAFDQLKALYLAAADADEKDRTLRALAHSPLAAPAALDLGLTPAVRAQDVRTLVGTAAAAGDAAAAAATWAWLKANWGALHAKLGGGCIARAQRSRPGDVDGASCCFVHVMPALGTLRCATRRLAPTARLSLVFFFFVPAGDPEASRRMGQLLEAVASASADPAMVADVDAVFAAHRDTLGGAQPYADRAKESIEANAAWVARHGEDVCRWVAAQAAAAAGGP
jgi:hypothetical protein